MSPQKSKKVVIFLSFVIVFCMLGYGIMLNRDDQRVFDELSRKVASFANTSKERIAHSVITVPDSHILVGLDNNTGSFKETGIAGKIVLSEPMVTKFVPGIRGKSLPRLDALSVMKLNIDNPYLVYYAVFVVLFKDTGTDAVLESYAKLDGDDILAKVKSIDITPGDAGEDYKADIHYTLGNIAKEVIIPVSDGHFVPDQTITK